MPGSEQTATGTFSCYALNYEGSDQAHITDIIDGMESEVVIAGSHYNARPVKSASESMSHTSREFHSDEHPQVHTLIQQFLSN